MPYVIFKPPSLHRFYECILHEQSAQFSYQSLTQGQPLFLTKLVTKSANHFPKLVTIIFAIGISNVPI